MSANTFPITTPLELFFDNSGNPCSNGTINVYFTGTQNAAVLFANYLGTANLANPVPLDSTGHVDMWGNTSLTYDLYLYDANSNLVRTYAGVTPGSGLLAGAMLLAGNQTANGNKIFSGKFAVGPGSQAEYNNMIYDAVFGSNATALGGFEVIGTQSANISLTNNEGVLNGGFGYNVQTDTLTIFCGGAAVATIGNSSVNFPAAATFTANGQTFLNANSVIAIAQGGTGATNATAALLALLPSTTNNTGNVLMCTAANTVAWNSVGGGSSTANGYYYIGTTLHQFGVIQKQASATGTSVSYPVTFPNNLFNIQLTSMFVGGTVPGYSQGVASNSKSGFTVSGQAYGASTPDATILVYWLAIGN